MIENSTLSGINWKIINHSAKETLVKTLKQNKTPKFEITSITGRNTEAGLDAYVSGSGNLICITNHKNQIFFQSLHFSQ